MPSGRSRRQRSRGAATTAPARCASSATAPRCASRAGARAPTSSGTPGRDEQQLAELGYKQELQRAWSGFTNFAISFTIISVLAGTFTATQVAWNAGGPMAISIGWPVLCGLVLLVAVSMAELTSA